MFKISFASTTAFGNNYLDSCCSFVINYGIFIDLSNSLYFVLSNNSKFVDHFNSNFANASTNYLSGTLLLQKRWSCQLSTT